MSKIIVIIVLIISLSATAFSQCITNIDFNTWSVAEIPTAGSWSPQSGGSRVFQSVNTGAPTFFISPFDLINVEITGTFSTSDNDDDWLGFVFGHQAPINQPLGIYDTWLFDWKQRNQNSNCGLMPKGKVLTRIVGSVPRSGVCSSPYVKCFSTHQTAPPLCTIVADDLGGAGWIRNFDHQFRIVYTLTRATIYIDNQLVFDIQDCFQPGRFGFYNYSQRSSTYKNFQYNLSIDFQVTTPTVCLGEAAEMQFLDPQCAGGYNYNLISSMVWDWGDGTSFTDNNPNVNTVNPTHYYTSPGNYTVNLTFTDGQGCSATASGVVVVNDTPVIAAQTVLNDVLCNGGSTGIIDITTSGSGLQYNWTPGGVITEDLTNASIGNYTVEITNSSGCTISHGPHLIDEPPVLTSTATIPVYNNGFNVSCAGQTDGNIDITPSGGKPPYAYTWIPVATSQDLNNVPAGNYSFTLTDANGCVYSDNFTLTEPPALTVNDSTSTYASGHEISCYGFSDGTIDITSNLQATYEWSNGQTSEDLTNIPAGSYTVTVTPQSGCLQIETIELREPDVLQLTGYDVDKGNGFGLACNGDNDGEILIDVQGGSGIYSYQWDDGETAEDRNGLSVGTYTVIITDENQCTTQDNYEITEPSLLVSSMDSFSIRCFDSDDGKLWPIISGGVLPYQYLWDNGTTESLLADLTSGTYNLVITDDNGCTSVLGGTLTAPDRHYVEIIPVPILPFGDTAELSINYFANNRPVSFNWSPDYQIDLFDIENPHVTPYGTTEYTVVMTDDEGCIAIATIIVEVKTNKILYIPNVFTPNGDGKNEGFHIYAKGVRDALVQVFDRWGEMIFETREFMGDRTKPWIGNHLNGLKAAPGVYTYRVSIAYEDGDLMRQAGSITLVR